MSALTHSTMHEITVPHTKLRLPVEFTFRGRPYSRMLWGLHKVRIRNLRRDEGDWVDVTVHSASVGTFYTVDSYTDWGRDRYLPAIRALYQSAEQVALWRLYDAHSPSPHDSAFLTTFLGEPA